MDSKLKCEQKKKKKRFCRISESKCYNFGLIYFLSALSRRTYWCTEKVSVLFSAAPELVNVHYKEVDVCIQFTWLTIYAGNLIEILNFMKKLVCFCKCLPMSEKWKLGLNRNISDCMSPQLKTNMYYIKIQINHHTCQTKHLS